MVDWCQIASGVCWRLIINYLHPHCHSSIAWIPCLKSFFTCHFEHLLVYLALELELSPFTLKFLRCVYWLCHLYIDASGTQEDSSHVGTLWSFAWQVQPCCSKFISFCLYLLWSHSRVLPPRFFGCVALGANIGLNIMHLDLFWGRWQTISSPKRMGSFWWSMELLLLKGFVQCKQVVVHMPPFERI